MRIYPFWGHRRIRTAVHGFADRWLSHSSMRPFRSAKVSIIFYITKFLQLFYEICCVERFAMFGWGYLLRPAPALHKLWAGIPFLRERGLICQNCHGFFVGVVADSGENDYIRFLKCGICLTSCIICLFVYVLLSCAPRVGGVVQSNQPTGSSPCWCGDEVASV